MNNTTDFRGWLADAQEHLRRAELSREHKNDPASYAIIVHYAQLALELSAKVIISYYHEPEWTHDPSKDLLNVIRLQGRKLEKRLGKATLRQMRRLALDAKQYADWHIWSTYGRREPGQPYRSPDAHCTAEVVADLMPRARHAVALAKRFAEVFA